MTDNETLASRLYPDHPTTAQVTQANQAAVKVEASPYDSIERANKASTPAEAYAIMNGKEPLQQKHSAEKPADTSGAQEKAKQPSSDAPVDVAKVFTDSGVDPSTLPESAADFIKANNLTGESVKNMVQLHHEAMQQAQAQAVEQWTSQTLAEVSQPDIQAAKSVIAKFGDDELKQVLNTTGIGSHPVLVKFLARVGKGRR